MVGVDAVSIFGRYIPFFYNSLFFAKKKNVKEYLPFILRLTEQLDRINAIWVFTHFFLLFTDCVYK